MSQTDGTSGYDDERPRRKKRPVLIVVLSLLTVVLIAGGVAFGYLYSLMNSFQSKAQTIESVFPTDEPRPERPEESADALNFLVIGSDVRGGSGETEDLPGVPNGGRADTMMLVNIPGDRSAVNVMSIMRDTWVEIPGHGEHKINAALAFGGVPLLVQTIEGLVEAPIDHVAIIDFEGFKALTDALGGVEVNNPRTFTSSNPGAETFPAGEITLDGESALKFVRERKTFGDGDYSRVANQQLFLKSVMSSFLNAETLSNPGRISEIVNEFSPYLTVDSELDAMTLGQLGFSMRNVRASDVTTFTLPNRGVGTSADGQSIVIYDPAATAEVAEAIKNDTLAQYVAENDLQN